MNLIRSLIAIISLSISVNSYASSNNDKFDWMNSDIKSMGSTIPSCLEPPKFTSITNNQISLNTDHSGKWIATGNYVQEDKLLQIKWSANKLKPRPRKYKLLYRIDPRFKRAQLFIQKYDYSQKRYLSDFHQYKNGQLLKYQDTPEMLYSQRIKDYSDYFDFNGRPKIYVQKNDVVNITIDNNKDYFGNDSQMQSELGYGDYPVMIYTKTSLKDNRIIYTNSDQWCSNVVTTSTEDYSKYCLPYAKYYRDIQINLKTLEGVVDSKHFNQYQQLIQSCPDNSDGQDNNPLCYYDQGRGMLISIGGTNIKAITEKFAYSPFSNKNFFYYQSDITGYLDFNTSWKIDGMYNSPIQFMSNFDKYNGSPINDYIKLKEIITSSPEFYMNFIHFGRYLMHVEVGHSSDYISEEDLQNIKVEYVILKDSVADPSTTGVSVDQNFRGNADKSGYLWMRIIAPDDSIDGTIQVSTANYTGSTWFSDVVYGDLVKPLREKFNELSKTIYSKLISNPTLQNIARTALTLYIILYGLMFLGGATQITTTNIVVRIIKITIVITLFSKTSWSFFSNNLFDLFVSGTDYLLTSIVGITGKTDNVFSFIDPIFDKYTNPRIWGLLFIQLLQIHNGLTFFAIMTIYGIFIYFRAIIEVIVSYCLAFLGLAVMISLAPLFITLILFERTKSMFDSWISVMFNYMMQPTILLIFFLLIEQIMGTQLSKIVVKACWDTLIPLTISLDLNNLGIPISFSFSLPFLPEIPFYVPQLASTNTINSFFESSGTFAIVATSSFLFFALCKLSNGLVDYVTLITQYLTNVLAARQYGKLQKGLNPIKDITDDMNKIVSPEGIFRSTKNFAKEKIIDQKISYRDRGKTGDINYNKIKKSNSSYKEGGKND